MKNIKSITVGLCLGMTAFGLTTVSAHTANAALMAVDLAEHAPADTFLTRDTATGLDWLDLPLTLGLSFDAITGGTNINGGALNGLNPITGVTFAANPFRHATQAEVLQLFMNAGIPDINSAFTDANFAPVVALQMLMGITFIQVFMPVGENISGQGVTSTVASAGTRIKPFYETQEFPGINRARARLDNTIGDSTSSVGIGHFLVRASTPSTALPEPGTLALFGLGLVGLGLARRRKAA